MFCAVDVRFSAQVFYFEQQSGCESVRQAAFDITRERAGYRRVLNEAEVVAFLGKLGFETVAFETMSVVEQATTMANCDVVVAPHGGGMQQSDVLRSRHQGDRNFLA